MCSCGGFSPGPGKTLKSYHFIKQLQLTSGYFALFIFFLFFFSTSILSVFFFLFYNVSVFFDELVLPCLFVFLKQD